MVVRRTPGLVLAFALGASVTHAHADPPSASSSFPPESCLERRVESLASCMNLAPAGTGTTSLFRHLLRVHNLSVERDLRRPPPSRDAAPWVHHNHSIRADSSLFSNGSRPAPCLLITLRDPVERLQSGWRYLQLPSARLAGGTNRAAGSRQPLERPTSRAPSRPNLSSAQRPTATAGRPSLRPGARHAQAQPRSGRYAWTRNLSSFVSALRDAAHPSHAEARLHYANRLAHRAPNPYLIRQRDYVQAADCAVQELHVICTDQFDRDWNALARSFGAHELIDAKIHSNARSRLERGTAEFALAPDEAAYVREVLYPEDTQLYARFCSGPRVVKPG